MKVKVKIVFNYMNRFDQYEFNSMREANEFLVESGYIYDSDYEGVDIWSDGQFSYAEVHKLATDQHI